MQGPAQPPRSPAPDYGARVHRADTKGCEGHPLPPHCSIPHTLRPGPWKDLEMQCSARHPPAALPGAEASAQMASGRSSGCSNAYFREWTVYTKGSPSSLFPPEGVSYMSTVNQPTGSHQVCLLTDLSFQACLVKQGHLLPQIQPERKDFWFSLLIITLESHIIKFPSVT